MKPYISNQSVYIRCIFLLFIGVVLYGITKTPLLPISGQIMNYVMEPLLWVMVLFLIWSFPRLRTGGKKRYGGMINIWAFNIGLIAVAVLFFAGLIGGFGKSPYDHSFFGLVVNGISFIAIIAGQEHLRSFVVNGMKKKTGHVFLVLVSLYMTAITIPYTQYLNNKGSEEWVQFLAQSIAPGFAEHLLATYLVYLGGPFPAIIYFFLVEGFEWFSPVLPDLQWITKSLLGTLTPIFSYLVLMYLYRKASNQISQDQQENPYSIMVSGVISIVVVWFCVGVFPIFPSAIATGSMEPKIQPGDVTIVKEIDGQKVAVGDVIQYQRDNIFISHRVIEVIREDSTILYKTKGDNNSIADAELVHPSQIKGEVIYVVPKIGWLSLIVRRTDHVPRNEVEF